MTASVFASRFMPGSDEMMSALSLARSTLPSSSGAAGEQAESSAAIPAKPNIFAISTPRSRKQWVLTLGIGRLARRRDDRFRSEEHTSELQSLMRISSAVFCLKKKKTTSQTHHIILHKIK